MKAIRRLIALVEWAFTGLISFFLLQFGSDRISRLVTSEYIQGDLSEIDGWLTTLGVGAIVSIFFLVHSNTRFYTAATLAVLLGGDSLKSLGFGDPQTLQVPLLSLAAATLVLLARRPSRAMIRMKFAPEIGDSRLSERPTNDAKVAA